MPAVIDETAQLIDAIYVSGGRIGSQIRLRPEELCQNIGGKFEDVLL